MHKHKQNDEIEKTTDTQEEHCHCCCDCDEDNSESCPCECENEEEKGNCCCDCSEEECGGGKCKELELQITEEKGKRLQLLADFENYKKRIDREREDMKLFGNTLVFNTLLEIADDLERGLADLEEVPTGLSLIKDKITNFISEHGIEEIPLNVGDKFTPSQMEAIGMITVEEDEKDNKIIHVERKGYKWKDKDLVVRTPRVIVGKKGK